MKFTPGEDIKKNGVTYEAGNTYDSAKHGIEDDAIKRWHAAGLCSIEGQEDNERRAPIADAELQIDNAGITAG